MRSVLLLLAAATCHAGNTVWPKPSSLVASGKTLQIPNWGFGFTTVGHDSETLKDAYLRYTALIFKASIRNGAGEARATRGKPTPLPTATLAQLHVNVLTDDESLTADTNETYALNIQAGNGTLTAHSVYGALRGLETFAQLVYGKGTLVDEAKVTDSPRFRFRAALIDTSRHFLPLAVIYENLDLMAYSKYNVLHWHIVDWQSFPYQSATFPQLSAQGAFTPAHVYTQTDVKSVIQYAQRRGIRVIPEFDTPGHMQYGYEAIPGLLTECYNSAGKVTGTGPLNPTLDSTYTFIQKLYEEVKSVFPDKYVMIGGDEVPSGCWESNPQIQSWVKQHPTVKTFGELEQYYALKLLDILQKQNTSYMCWQEIFQNGVKIYPDTVVNVWKDGNWQDVLGQVVQAGYHSVLSAPFYLNKISYGEDWKAYYSTEPLDFTCPDPSKPCDKSLVDGIEMAMWGEWVDGTNFIQRTWPRAAAVGERAWSSEATKDVGEAEFRIHEFRCKMVKRGSQAEPIINPNLASGYCEEEFLYEYRPVWQS